MKFFFEDDKSSIIAQIKIFVEARNFFGASLKKKREKKIPQKLFEREKTLKWLWKTLVVKLVKNSDFLSFNFSTEKYQSIHYMLRETVAWEDRPSQRWNDRILGLRLFLKNDLWPELSEYCAWRRSYKTFQVKFSSNLFLYSGNYHARMFHRLAYVWSKWAHIKFWSLIKLIAS